VYNYENEWMYSFGVQLNKQISPVFGIRGQGLYGKLAGTRREWNKHFKSDYYEFNLNTTININNIFAPYRHDRFLNVYIIFGLGLLNYNTSIYELGTNKLLQSVGNGSGTSFNGRTLEGVMLGGLGFDFRLSDRWSINLETANRAMNSDMLDGHISGFKYDVYNITTLGFSYKFGYSKKNSQITEYDEGNTKSTNLPETVEYDYWKSDKPETSHPEVIIFSPNIITEPLEEEDVVVIVEEPVYEEVVIKDVVVIEEEVVISGFEYRVQIRAKYGNAISISHLNDLYDISAGEIRQDSHNGYYIYSVGSFNTYEQAKIRRNELRSYNGISDAFVVAFRNGQRLDKLP